MPVALDPVIAKLLAKDRDQRYHSAEELLVDLEALSGAPSPSNGPLRPVSGPSVPAASVALPQAAQPRARSRMIALGVLLLVGFAGAVSLLHNHLGAKPAPATSATAPPPADQAAKPATSKDAIIVADFINKTGDPVFDTTLNQALRVQLGQSPVLDIISQQHLRQSLQFLGRKQDETITPANRPRDRRAGRGKGHPYWNHRPTGQSLCDYPRRPEHRQRRRYRKRRGDRAR
jgi:hypothetical protein